MAVMVWFADAWGPYEARAVAEVTESLAEALVDAGVAVVVDVAAPVVVGELDGVDGEGGSDEAEGLDGSEGLEAPEPEQEAPKQVKGRGRKRR